MFSRFTRRLPDNPGTYSLLLALFWSAVMAVSFLASTHLLRREIRTIAQNIARAYIDKDILYRNWNALHGGVYVPVDNGLTPNPFYPPSMPERDLVTPTGRRLTFVNPSYMMRQIYELSRKEQQVSGRITSLRPLNPANAASQWEAQALLSFESGKREASGMITESGNSYIRVMRPLMTEESCLACHAQQGYRKGDVRGGISITMPMGLLESGLHSQMALLGAGHAAMWIFGLGGLFAGYRGLLRRTRERDRALDELRRVNAILEDQASTDAVTGILNRRRFSQLLEEEMVKSRRYGLPVALIFFDVDHFKAINDRCGHEAGDCVLRELSRLVSGMIRKTDVFARFGGEEFVVLVHDNDAESGRVLAEKIRSRVSLHEFAHVGRVTCSFGVAQFHPDDSAQTLIKRADDAMYAAKYGGRNRVESCCDCR